MAPEFEAAVDLVQLGLQKGPYDPAEPVPGIHMKTCPLVGASDWMPASPPVLGERTTVIWRRSSVDQKVVKRWIHVVGERTCSSVDREVLRRWKIEQVLGKTVTL